MPVPTTDASDRSEDHTGEGPWRLPRTASPVRYELELTPDLAGGTFQGSAVIDLDVHDTVGELVCNAAGLTLHSAEVRSPAGIRHQAAVRVDEPAERVHFLPDEPLEAGRWSLYVTWSGSLTDGLRGFYRTRATGPDGVERVLAVTQFEATDARRAFPCWDEPDRKARFAVSLVVDDDLLALSNTAAIDEEPIDGGRRRVRFAETIPMSTYLVAFVVGPLECTGPVDAAGVPVRVVHLPGQGRLASFALEVAGFCLPWFADYYGLPYPSDKLDLVAVPDFAFGAMENLGCVTFREALVLVDPERATQVELQRVADVIAHELAHMWFGDLVTMKWWNGIWLNEAFATFMECLAVDAFRPGWKRWEAFALERTVALETDALASTRPIEYPVHSPADADGMFDVLTYLKGCAVVRMLEQHLGAERFRDGIRHYLRQHTYANTETTDLWDALEASTGEPVRRIMDTWIFQGGYPLVTVEPIDAGVTVRTSRFAFDPASVSVGSWTVPLRVRAADEERSVLVEGDTAAVGLADPLAAVVVNAGARSFVRVRYDPALLARLTATGLAALDTVERYALLDDLWSSVLAGVTPAADVLAVLEAFAGERALAVWRLMAGVLDQLDRLVAGPARQVLQARVRALAGPALERLTWEPFPGEDPLDAELRGVVVRTLAVLGADADAAAWARRLHEQDRDRPGVVEPNLAAAAVAVVAATGGPDDWDRFVALADGAPTPQEQLRYLYALAEFSEDELADRTLLLTLTDRVRVSNAPFVLAALLRNRTQGPRAWAFVREHGDALRARIPANLQVRMFDGIKALDDPEVADDVARYFAEHPLEVGGRTLAQHLERQRVAVALRRREAQRLADALT